MSGNLQTAPKDATSGSIAVVDGVAAPAHVHNALPYDAAGLAIDLTTAIAHYYQGLPYTSAGRLACSTDAVDHDVFSSTSRLCVSQAAVSYVIGGVPHDANSAVSCEGIGESVPAGSMAITGYVPSLLVMPLAPAAGSLAITGYAPNIGERTPAAESLVLTGYIPVVTSS